MKINERILNFIDILGDLEDISKNLYLESPELWIDFSDKIADQNIDEMVLFYATKYNYVSILKFVVENKIVNLDSPSKNKSFSSIKTHLIAAAKEYNSIDVYNYLTQENNSSDMKSKDECKVDDQVDTRNDGYYPVYNCPTCNKNIFKVGYKVLQEVCYSFSTQNNKCEETSIQKDSRVFCCNCNGYIEHISTDLLEKMCSVNNCRNCGKDLTQTGIEQKIKMRLDTKSNAFVSSEKTYVCSSCQEPLNETQVKNFNL